MSAVDYCFGDLERTARRLTEVSRAPEHHLHDPFNRVDYPDQLDASRLQFPEEMLSLYYHPIYKELTNKQKWELSLYETINFFSINIHGERNLIRGIEEKLYVQGGVLGSYTIGTYLQHFIHEENSHTNMLAGYCFRYGDGVLKDNAIQLGDPELSPVGQELLFFGRVFVFEMFLDYLNGNAMRDGRIDATARTIHGFHHAEEARHMAFDRSVMSYCVAEAKRQGLNEDLETVGELLFNFGRIATHRLYSANVYRKIGIRDPVTISKEAPAFRGRIEIDNAWRSRAENFLTSLGLAG